MRNAYREVHQNLSSATQMADEEIKKILDQTLDASGDVKKQLQSAIEQIREERDKMIYEGHRISLSSGENWEKVQNEAAHTIEEAKTSIREIVNKVGKNFKSKPN